MQQKFLTVDEVAELLKLNSRTIRQYITDRQLQAIKLPNNGSYRIPLNYLEDFLNQRTLNGKQ